MHKAFDSVSIVLMLHVFVKLGLLTKTVRILQSSYEGTKIRVIVFG